ncbi:MAG: WbqC family protein [Bacteroidales bacterium]
MLSKTLLLSNTYMPPLSFFAGLLWSESYVIDEEENYEKQSFRNRAWILTSQGVQTLSVPVIQTDGNHTSMKRIKICNIQKWQRDHWRSLCTAYGNSPYFLYYRDELEVFFSRSYEYLWTLNEDLLDFFVKKLKIQAHRIDYNLWLKNSMESIKSDGIKSEDTLYKQQRWRSFPAEKKSMIFQDLHVLSASSKKATTLPFLPYITTFEAKLQDWGHLSIMDLLCNLGPDAVDYLKKDINLDHW